MCYLPVIKSLFTYHFGLSFLCLLELRVDSLVELVFLLFEDFRFDGLAELGEDLLRLVGTPGVILRCSTHIIAPRRRRGRHQSARASLKLAMFLLHARLAAVSQARSCSQWLY